MALFLARTLVARPAELDIHDSILLFEECIACRGIVTDVDVTP
jgi:hypothetical protein